MTKVALGGREFSPGTFEDSSSALTVKRRAEVAPTATDFRTWGRSASPDAVPPHTRERIGRAQLGARREQEEGSAGSAGCEACAAGVGHVVVLLAGASFQSPHIE